MGERLAILGLGLMGGSLGLAARKRGIFREVRGYARRAETREAALAMGCVDRVAEDAAEAVDGADMVVVCVPVLAMPGLLRTCASALGAGTVVTDVGSTKGWLIGEMDRVAGECGAIFVGSHPICGSEQAGIDAADVELYSGAVTVLTPEAERMADAAYIDAVARVRGMWTGLGARVREVAASTHDELLAATSHLPHLVAVALVETVLSEPDTAGYCGSGFRDTTRVAAGSAGMWSDILETNQAAVVEAMAAFGRTWSRLTEAVERGDRAALQEILERAGQLRRTVDSGAEE